MFGKEKTRSLLQTAGLPEDVLFDCARVVVNGRKNVVIEGQHGVVELSEQRIRLKTGNGILCVRGMCLELTELSPEKAVISGREIGEIAYQ